MSAKDRARIARLEAENARLRESVEKHLDVYRAQALELIDLRTRLDLVRQALNDKEPA